LESIFRAFGWIVRDKCLDVVPGHRTSVDKGGHDEAAIFNRAFWQSTTDVLRSRGEPQRIVVKIAKLPELFTLSATRTRSDVRFRGNSGHQRAAIGSAPLGPDRLRQVN
jgi:hypothetical protein